MFRSVKKNLIAMIILTMLGGFAVSVNAAFNEQINFQGKLTNSSNLSVADGNNCMKFSLYTASAGGSSIWSEEWKASTSYIVTTSGLFSVLLGSNTVLSSVNFNQSALYLQVEYDPACDGTYEESFSPRKLFGAVPAAFEAKKLAGYTWATPDAIGTSTPSTGAFTTLFAGIGAINPLAKLHVEGQCVTGDTMLRRRRRKLKSQISNFKTTTQNLKPNETEDENYIYDDVMIKDVKPGDEIQTLDENKGKLVWSKVNALMDMGVKQIFELKTEDGKTIRTTGNHPYLAIAQTKNPTNSEVLEDPALQRNSRVATDSISIANQSGSSINEKASSCEEAPSRSLLTCSLHSKLNWHQTLSLVYYNQNCLSIALCENIKTPVDPAGLAPATSGVNSEYLLHNTTGLRPGSFSLYQNEIQEAIWTKVAELSVGDELAVASDDLQTVKFVKIKEINIMPAEQVYDIEVEETHNFIGNGIVAHNTYINGNLGIGTTGPDAKLDSLAITGAQLRLTYADGTVYSDFTTNATGDLTITPSSGKAIISGDLTITGDDIFLTTNTIGALLVGDGTNFNQVVGTGDAEIAANGTITIVNDSHSHTSTTLPGTTSYLGSTIAADELASADFGLFSCNGSTCSADNDSITLATHTTGNYVATIADSGASEITVASSGTENAAVTLALAAGITRDVEWDTESEVQTAWGSVNILLETEIDASSELITLMDDETGTGYLVFANTPILITPTISGLFTLSSSPTGTGVSQGTIYINPSSATADYTLLGVAVNGSSKFRVDAEGDTTISGDLTITGDDIFLTTNTIGALLVGDGTNFNPVVGTGDAEIAANGTITIVNDSHSHTSTTLPGTTSYLGSTIAADELASADFGLFSCNGSTCSADNDSITLATHTTGNYVATIADSGASEITVANSGTENAAVTLALAAGITRDVEWDTESEVQTAWGSVNILLETEIDASSELITLMDDETGTGYLVFSDSPTFITQMISPKLIGGTATTTDLYLQTTTGIGTTGADMHFLVGSNGGTEAMTIL